MRRNDDRRAEVREAFLATRRYASLKTGVTRSRVARRWRRSERASEQQNASSSQRFTSTPCHVLPPILHLGPPLILKSSSITDPSSNPTWPLTHLSRRNQRSPHQYVPVSERPSPKTAASLSSRNSPQRMPVTNAQTIPPARSLPLITITALSQNSLFTRTSLATNTPTKKNTVASWRLPQ